MELLILGGIIFGGMTLNKKSTRQNNVNKRESVIQNDIPNGSNIYTSNYANEADLQVFNKSSQNYIDAQDPKITGILPPIFNTYGVNGNKNVSGSGEFKMLNSPLNTLSGADMNKVNEINRRMNIVDSKSTNIVDRPMFSSEIGNGIIANTEGSLINENVGIPFNKNKNDNVNPLTGLPYESAHKNMVPFFGGNVKQNIETLTNVPLLDLYSGNTDTFKHKKEIGSFHTLQKQDIHGTASITVNTDLNRYIPSNFKEGEKPFYPELVAAPISGTIDNKIRNYGTSVDQLRVASKPKLSFKGRTIAGQFMNTRGVHAEVKKNLVNTFYEQTPDMYLKTTGLIKANEVRERFSMKPTERQDYTDELLKGPSYHRTFNKTIQRTVLQNGKTENFDSIVKESSRQNLDYQQEFLRNVDGPEKHSNDYGKKGYTPYITERSLDRTDQYDLNVNSQKRGTQIYNQDLPKNTIKQTTLIGDTSGFIKSTFDKGSSEAYNEDIQHWSAKHTQKELLVNNKYIGNIEKPIGMGYNIANYDAKTTSKETTMLEDYNGISDGLLLHPEIYSTYKNPIKTRNVVSVDYTGSSAPVSRKDTMSRNDYNNAEINDDKEILLMNSRPSGPNIYQIDAGVDALGKFKYTENMALKGESSYRRLQDVDEHLNAINPYLTTPLQNLGIIENKSQDLSEITNKNITPQYINNQLSNNPYFINTQGKI